MMIYNVPFLFQLVFGFRRSVEGVEGHPVTLPCTLTGTGDLTWSRTSDLIILLRRPDGRVVIPGSNNPYHGVVSLVGGTNLRINSLEGHRDRVNAGVFSCKYSDQPSNVQETQIGFLVPITGSRINGFREGALRVAGRGTRLACTVDGNPIPAPSYTWRVDGGPVIAKRQTFYLKADRSMRTVTCTATNSYSNGTEFSRDETTLSLNVQYPPFIRVTYNNSTQTLTCTATGVPATYNVSFWEHRLGGKLLRVLRGTPSSAILKLRGTSTYEDTGDYACRVSKGIKGELKEGLQVVPQTAAVFQQPSDNTELTVGATGTLSVSFYTHSETPNVTVEWRKTGESTLIPSHREEAGPVSLMIHGQNVSIHGTVSTMTLTNVTLDDSGNYSVTVTNVINDVPESRHISVHVTVQQPVVSTTVKFSASSGHDQGQRSGRNADIGDDQGQRSGGNADIGDDQGQRSGRNADIAPIVEKVGVVGGVVVLTLVVGFIILFIQRRRTVDPSLPDDGTDGKQTKYPEETEYATIG